MNIWKTISFGLACVLAAYMLLLQQSVSRNEVLITLVGPGQYEGQVRAFEAQSRARRLSGPPILFMGSSSIAHWQSLAADFPQFNVVNCGLAGSLISDSTFFAPQLLSANKPCQIVFYAGSNDIRIERTPEQVAADFGAFVKKAHQLLPKVPIVFISIFPTVANWGQHLQVEQANLLVRGNCAKDPLLSFVNVTPAMMTGDGKLRRELFEGDGIHMKPQGYAIWRRIIRPVLSEQGKKS